MKYLYYCNSPYQLFNVINLNWHRKYNGFENIKDYSADLIISNTFKSSNELYEILKNDDMFSNVILSHRLSNTNKFHKVSTFLDFLFPSRYIYKTTDIKAKYFNRKYDYICMPKATSIVLAIWTKNKNAHIELFEEGFGTLYGGEHMSFERGTHQWIYETLNGCKKLVNSYERIYINDLSLYLDNDINKLVKIPKIDSECLNRVSNIFDKVLVNNCDKHIFWLGQYIKDNVNNVTKEVLKTFSKEVVYIPHPRFKNEFDSSFEELELNKFWEINLSKLKDINNKCFISAHSTAVLSPKLLFDEEPYVILTYRMIEDPTKKDDCEIVDRIITKFRSTYKNPNKVMLPRNKSELIECLKTYTNNVNLV